MLGLGLIAALVPAPVVPEPQVRWTAPAGCPDQARVRSQIEALLGRPLEDGELNMQGVITSNASGWTLSLTTKVDTLVDERSLEANDCSVLADAAALVAVVMLDPVQATDTIEDDAAAAEAARTQPTTPARPVEAPALPDPDPPPDPVEGPDPVDEAAASRSSPAWMARLRAGGEFGAVPGGTGVFDLGLSVGGLGRAGRLRAELVGLYAIGREAASANARIRVHLGAAAPRVCAALRAGPVDVPLCAGVELGAMQADANGGGTTRALWLAAQAEPGVRWSFSDRLSLWVAAQVVVPLRYPDFELVTPTGERAEAVHRPQPVAARGLAGLEVRLAGPPTR